MNCKWKDMSGTVDAAGWRKVVCVRCGRRTNPTPHSHDSIFADCRGIPYWHEFGFWAEIGLQVIGITKGRWAWAWGNPACTTCAQRERDLNTLGARFKQGLLSIWGKIRAFWNKE